MDMILYLLLCLYWLRASASSGVILRTQQFQNDKSQDQEWICPQSADVAGISCSCDVQHTVRCRGEAKSPEILKVFTDRLSQELPPDEFVSLLDLSIHSIKHLPPGVFSKLKLMGLVISRAGIQVISPGTFVGLEKDLAALGLPGNQLNLVPSEALEDLHSLRWLDLGSNQIEGLQTRVFPRLDQLENLNLDNNNIYFLETESLARLSHLKNLNLANNKIPFDQLNERSLWGLESLKELNLQANQLNGTLLPTFLSSLTNLHNLDLSHNSISKITLNALSGCERLQKLDLSHNHIDVIEDNSFQYLSSLVHLELSHNNIVAVSGLSLAHLSSLQYLGIADNSLLAITGDLLHQLPLLKKLDASFNDISIIQPNVFQYTQNLLDIDFTDNPLHCDCTLTWLWKWFQKESIGNTTRRSLICATPSSLENFVFSELNASDLVCLRDGTDYYHDSTIDYEESAELRMSEAEIVLRQVKWTGQNIDLTWRIDQKAIPYRCQSLHIYERTIHEGEPHQIISNILNLNCSSDGSQHPNTVEVSIPGDTLTPGHTFRYCLLLIERGTSDVEGILPGCSEPIPFVTDNVLSSLTAGSLGENLLVQIKFSHTVPLCSYQLYRLRGSEIEEVVDLSCSESRHLFTNVTRDEYTVCVDIKHLSRRSIEEKLRTLPLEQALSSFQACTTVTLESQLLPSVVMTLLFTVPGLAVMIGVYILGRRMWRRHTPWKWDPRATKRVKYFLYTGESTSPSLSLDPLPIAMNAPESTTRV